MEKTTTKDRVLAALEKNKGSFVSGENLAKECNVSRNAVWKSITELKKSGYNIKSVNNRGYSLEEESDIISKAGILLNLERLKKSEAFADRIYVYDEIDSTNTEAKRSIILSNPLPHGMVIAAKSQSAGRGHKGSSFLSPDGGIYFSIILEPDRVKDKKCPITERVPETVKKILEKKYDINLTIKGTGSLYLGNEKVCGIMTEGFCDLETGIYSSFIVGIGILAEKLPKDKCAAAGKNEIISEIISELI